jgi:hypothetical protein
MAVSTIQNASLASGVPNSAAIGSGTITETNLATAVIPLGVGQTWQSFLGARSLGTTYTNSTGRPIFVIVSISQTTNGIGHQVYIGALTYNAHQQNNNNGSSSSASQFVVPNGSTYSIAAQTGEVLDSWLELR